MYDRERLEACRERILKEKSLALSTAGDCVDRILNPSDRKDWHKIRYFNRMKKSIKDEFQKKSVGLCIPGDMARGGNVAVATFSANIGTKCFQ
ncbi:hypothetical protein OS493_026714 [Desmophyllum pertusum]|uniref:Uncharacterized protein n=1 Tax=Desmophyllum pertusum TaxID=174260 RepID=A0A9X0A226_9CNID|nr:hypothetical protein OS493_026714 [Desmophyllum pertusum]